MIESESQPGGRIAAGLAPVSALGSSAAAGGSDADRAVTKMYRMQYRGLVRLAVLLVGELGTAEEVVQDAFAAMHGEWRRLRNLDAALSFLHHSVVAGSRALAPALAAAPQYEAPADEPGERVLQAVPSRPAGPAGGAALATVTSGPATVISALQRLPGPQREALALRLYLDLRDDQIAAAMQVTRAAARGHVAGGLAAMRGVA